MRGHSAFRRLLLVLALAGLVVYAWLAVQVYRSKADPEGFRAWDGAYAWIVGPSAKSLNRVADEHLDAAVEILNDPALPPVERLAAYRERLERAERLLERSLRAQPAQANTLARLAAVRWELSPPVTAADQRRFLEMIATASRMAPRVPRVQLRLGDLLLRMGHEDEATSYLARAVTLDPATAREAVELLRNHLFEPERIRDALPPAQEVLVALMRDFLEADRADAYLDAVESVPHPSARLIGAHASAAIASRRSDRLAGWLDRIGPVEDPEIESERLLQRSRAMLEAGDPARALEDARAARSLRPDRPRFAEYLGVAALAAGAPDEALDAFRAAVAETARRSDDEAWRARLYRRIGQAEEARGEPGRAYDAYRRALELDPAEPHARRRIDEMREAAGVREESP